MNFIDSVQISGFWGQKRVDVKFNRDINFLIGKNGSGKTTVINIIAAALTCDVPSLHAAVFEKITIVLKSQGMNRKPVIEIAKSTNDLLGSIEISYLIKEKTTDKGIVYRVEAPYDERSYREPRLVRNRRTMEAGAKLRSVLSAFTEVNWLSVHRGASDRYPQIPKEEEYDSAIDQKLAEISRKFASYFSLLASKASEEMKKFQEQVFLSLLENEQNTVEAFLSGSDDSEERTSIVNVLKDLGVSNAKAARSINNHYAKLEPATKMLREESRLTIDSAATLSDARRLRQLITKWRDFNITRDRIYSPRVNFERIINSLFTDKELHFDQRNIPEIFLLDGEKVSISLLSSGEKQLFILLGEALLQEGRPVVFISDEPELSLHVAWQASLFENVRNLNPACQIISATHSPDIVGPFQSQVIQIEDCFTNA